MIAFVEFMLNIYEPSIVFVTLILFAMTEIIIIVLDFSCNIILYTRQNNQKPTYIYSRIEHIEMETIDSLVCSICLDEENKVDVKLKCNHMFHESCITSWFKQNTICPICRAQNNVV